MLDRSSLMTEYQLPSISPKYKQQPYKPSLSRRQQHSEQRMRMVLNSVSMSKSTDRSESQAIILPSNKFNKIIKLIQVQRDQIKPLKPRRPVINFNEQWKYNEGHISPPTYERRAKGKRIKTETEELEDKWTFIKKKGRNGQLFLKFPQLGLAKNQFLVTPQCPAQKQLGKSAFKSKSHIIKVAKTKNEGIKQTVALLHKTEPMDANMDISAWTMNDF